MKIQGMDKWGEMTASARLELVGNALVQIADRIPDTAGGEADTRPVLQQDLDPLKEVIGEIVELCKKYDEKFAAQSSVSATIVSNSSRIEACEQAAYDLKGMLDGLKREVEEMVERVRGNREEVLGRVEDLVKANDEGAKQMHDLKVLVGNVQESIKKSNERIDALNAKQPTKQQSEQASPAAAKPTDAKK